MTDFNENENNNMNNYTNNTENTEDMEINSTEENQDYGEYNGENEYRANNDLENNNQDTGINYSTPNIWTGFDENETNRRLGEDNNMYSAYNVQNDAKKRQKSAKKGFFFNKRKLIASCAAAALLFGGFAGGTAYADLRTDNRIAALESKLDASSVNHSASAIRTTDSGSTSGTKSLRDIVSAVSPSVVGITITTPASQSTRGAFVWETQGEEVSGTGFIMNYDGYIATNYHVAETAAENSNALIEVTLADGRTAEAKYVAGDEQNDLAVIKIDLDNLTPVTLGDSDDLMVGDTAIAIGNPLGSDFAGSVTSGIISGINRNLGSDNTADSLIQTDAAINPGNSGGPLLNANGEVVGINTVKIASTEVEGIGFAIPINDAYPILESLMKYGYVKDRPILGVGVSEVTEVMSSYYNVPTGLLVQTITEGSGAASSGIEAGDIITKVDGTDIATTSDIKAVLKQHSVGDTVKVEVYRNGDTKTFDLKLTEDKGESQTLNIPQGESEDA